MSKANDVSGSGIDWENGAKCSKVICDSQEPERTSDWKQGLAIALGAPLLILQSIGYFAGWLWSAPIIVWALSVFQGAGNIAYLNRDRLLLKTDRIGKLTNWLCCYFHLV